MSKWHKNWFSNMLPLDKPFVEDGISYRTSEHYYQAQKCVNREDRIKLSLMGPHEAKRRVKEFELRPDWDDIKLDVMEKILRYKFGKGTSWYDKLMETGDQEILELNNWNDKWWGVDITTGVGRNELGKILMKIRNEYKFNELFE